MSTPLRRERWKVGKDKDGNVLLSFKHKQKLTSLILDNPDLETEKEIEALTGYSFETLVRNRVRIPDKFFKGENPTKPSRSGGLYKTQLTEEGLNAYWEKVKDPTYYTAPRMITYQSSLRNLTHSSAMSSDEWKELSRPNVKEKVK